ncbi:MAG: isoprenylcysteine carboxylmethyltransferase family protein [Gemmatimonadaceae bacterium]
MQRNLSIVSLLVMVVALVALYRIGALFSWSPLVIAIQVVALLLMLWARVTFGMRSFHAAANPTAGGLVTTGPYRYIRHPIYTAALLFTWSGALAHASLASLGLALAMTAGAAVRMWCEEQMVTVTYPEYRDYARRTKRVIPGLL